MNDLFNTYYKEYDAWFEKNKWAYLSELEAVKKVLPGDGYGLEVGVGSGRFAAPLGIDEGIDPSDRMVELARARGVEAKVGRGEELAFRDSSFDYVVFIFALCFVEDPGKAIKEAKRVLKKRGKIIIGIIDKDSFLGRSYLEKKSMFYDRARFFSVNELVRMLGSAGFGQFSYLQTISDYPDRLHGVERARKGYGKGGFVLISADKK